MNMQTAVRRGFGQTFSWKGRATRSEYWWFVLLSAVCYIACLALSALLENPVLLLVWAVVFIVPTLGLGARRLHDTDRNAAWLLLGLVPYAGLVLLVFYCLPGTPRVNRFGHPDPEQAARAHRKLAGQFGRIGEDHIAAGHAAQALTYARAAGRDIGIGLPQLAEYRDRLGTHEFRRSLDEVLNNADVLVQEVDEAFPPGAIPPN